MSETSFVVPEDQRFACRDCPAKCCKQWSIRITGEERDRFMGEEWIRERLAGHGLAMEEPKPGLFQIPMRAVGGIRQCVFLDDDQLCSIHRRHGHDFLSATCKSFPFMFLRAGEAPVRPVLSQYCPSIRDNYGEPVGLALLAEKWGLQQAASYTLAGHMRLGPVTRLSEPQFLHLSSAWRRLVMQSGTAAEGLARCQFLTARLTEESGAAENAGESFVERTNALAAEAASLTTMTPVAGDLGVRLLLAFVLFSISSPFRLKGTSHTSGRVELARVFLGLLTRRGKTDLLYMPGMVRLANADAVSSAGPDAQKILTGYLALVLERQTLLHQARPMQEVLHRVALAMRVADLYARLLASAEGRSEVNVRDMKEGISIAELTVVLHANLMATVAALEITTGMLALQSSHMGKLIGMRAD
jgi:lysine-N-methylase